TAVYLVSLRSSAAITARFTLSGVGKSGSPDVRVMMSRPCARRSRARALATWLGLRSKRRVRAANWIIERLRQVQWVELIEAHRARVEAVAAAESEVSAPSESAPMQERSCGGSRANAACAPRAAPAGGCGRSREETADAPYASDLSRRRGAGAGRRGIVHRSRH